MYIIGDGVKARISCIALGYYAFWLAADRRYSVMATGLQVAPVAIEWV